MKQPARPHLSSIQPKAIYSEASAGDVFVGGTAYNFLNVFRGYPAPSTLSPLSESKVHRLTFACDPDAAAAFALLASRTAFWLWHVEGDGFHVPAWFLDELPLFDLTWDQKQFERLRHLGAALWAQAKTSVLASNNGGKWTLAFRATSASDLRDTVDGMILQAIEIDTVVLGALLDFERQITSVDGKERIAPVGGREEAITRILSR